MARVLSRQTRWVWILAHLFCICIFLVQLVQLLPSYFAPTMTHTEVRDVPLKEMGEFPLDLKMCVKPGLNNTALNQLGYASAYDFTVGINPDLSLIGWGGYDNQSRLVGSGKEVLKMVNTNLARELIFAIIGHYSYDGTLVDLTSEVLVENINWVGDCHILNFAAIGRENITGHCDLSICAGAEKTHTKFLKMCTIHIHFMFARGNKQKINLSNYIYLFQSLSYS